MSLLPTIWMPVKKKFLMWRFLSLLLLPFVHCCQTPLMLVAAAMLLLSLLMLLHVVVMVVFAVAVAIDPPPQVQCVKDVDVVVI